MSLSKRAKKGFGRAFTDNKSKNEVVAIVEEIMSIFVAQAAKLDSDTGVADTDYADLLAGLQAIIDANSGN